MSNQVDMLVTDAPEETFTKTITYTHKIKRRGPTRVVSRVLLKNYKPHIYNKRAWFSNYSTLPWGYKKEIKKRKYKLSRNHFKKRKQTN